VSDDTELLTVMEEWCLPPQLDMDQVIRPAQQRYDVGTVAAVHCFKKNYKISSQHITCIQGNDFSYHWNVTIHRCQGENTKISVFYFVEFSSKFNSVNL